MGERIGSEFVTLIDDPFFVGGLHSRPFDSEGTPSSALTVVERGVLRSFLHNAETARATGQANTGHADRSYRGTLDVGPSNFYLHAGANPISGDVSVQAFGLLVEGSEVAHPVEDFTVSGNLLELLLRVVGVGDTLEWGLYGGALGTPTVEVADVSFAGA